MSRELRLSRRELLRRAGEAVALAAAARVLPPVSWLAAHEASAQAPTDPLTIETLEAFADTLIPGQKRHPGDRAIAGAARGPGAVQAGAMEMWFFPGLGAGPTAQPFATMLNVFARGRVPATATAPPEFVQLDFAQRTELLRALFHPDSPDRQWWAVGAHVVFVAFHTAGFAHTAEVARRHPGLRSLRFPLPDRDGLWRFPRASYRRVLARPHPRTARRGHPA